jgi:hypothetical protein
MIVYNQRKNTFALKKSAGKRGASQASAVSPDFLKSLNWEKN